MTNEWYAIAKIAKIAGIKLCVPCAASKRAHPWSALALSGCCACQKHLRLTCSRPWGIPLMKGERRPTN